MPVASAPTPVTTLHWLVVIVASICTLAGGWSLAKHLPRWTPLAVAGEAVGVAALVYLVFYAGIPVGYGLAPLLLGSLGLVAGLVMARK